MTIAWDEAVRYLSRRLEVTRVLIEGCMEQNRLYHLQGKAAELRVLLRLPDLLAAEREQERLAKEARG